MSDVPQSAWPGHYYDGRTATRHSVTVTLTTSGLELHMADGSKTLWPYGEVTQTQGSYEHEPVRLERGVGLPEALVVEDLAFLDVLRQFSRGSEQDFAGPPERASRFRIIFLAGVASIAAIAVLIIWGIPALAELATPLIPISWENALGDSVATQLAPTQQRCTNERLRESLDQVVTRLVASGPASPYQFQVAVSDSQVFNAFAAPGGYIVIHRRLLESTETPEELAGVLAHEMQHVFRRHAMKALVRDLSTAAIIGAVFGDVSGIGAFAVQGARTMTTLHYSRENEEEADREGMRLLMATHVEPAGMVRFFETLKRQTGRMEPPAYLSTHPDTDARIARLKTLGAELGTDLQSVPIPLLTGVKWDEVKKLCR
jgi:Zn-dependent protease with chaperone function